MEKGDIDGKSGQSKQESGVSPIIDEVNLLQKTLNQLGFNAGVVDGIFGSITHSAVVAFQEKHFDEVLAPWGLARGTGKFYQSTERWMNEVLGCEDSVVLDNGKVLS